MAMYQCTGQVGHMSIHEQNAVLTLIWKYPSSCKNILIPHQTYFEIPNKCRGILICVLRRHQKFGHAPKRNLQISSKNIIEDIASDSVFVTYKEQQNISPGYSCVIKHINI